MSNFGSIHTYRSEVDQIKRYGGSTKETSIRRAFSSLINAYARPRDLLLVEELDYYNPRRHKRVTPDGTLKNSLRLDYGFWESKDTDDDLDGEIAKKFDKGYPDTNILFEDSQTAILYQDGQRLLETRFTDDEALDQLLTTYVSFEHPEVREFKAAVEHFKQDIPSIVTALREMILKQGKTNIPFRQRRDTFLELCRSAINPTVTPDDVDEMLIQHILTEEIFISIFSETQFLDENNIARELKQVENTFFTGATKRETLGKIKHYYECIKAHATSIVSPREKQTFLKVIYENFYKAYNPKGADRLGIVYTPGEIIDFMIRSTETLLHRHFGRGLADKGVEILDPATGTGSYICDIIEHLPREVLARKYKSELHANEVAILPYYIANLNIETAYAAKMGTYVPFDNICFVDTLDNTEGLQVENQWELGGLSLENTRRIKAQNKRKISVIIGNPPYNANQQNENDNNKNRLYEHIDKRIKATYIHESTAQKTKLYDMYSRFVRWASDRLPEQGIIAFVSNSSFVHKRTFDGFRKTVAQEFDHIYVLDCKGDAHTSGEQRQKEGGNIFDDKIKVGIAIYFLVRTGEKRGCTLSFKAVDDYLAAESKIQLVSAAKIETLEMERIEPDINGNWLDTELSDYESLVPLVGENEKAVFGLASNGVVSNRDEWVYDVDKASLTKKAKFLSEEYNRLLTEQASCFPNTIKWSESLKSKFKAHQKSKFSKNYIIDALYRPFTKLHFYSEKIFNDRLTDNHYQLYGPKLDKENVVIGYLRGNREAFSLSVGKLPIDLHFFVGDSVYCLALYRYDDEGNRQDNLSDWGLRQFQEHYGNKAITKLEIFHYTYAVLHHPAYRAKYEINLKREFPRLPFYENFPAWVAWGKSLMELHLGYEQAAPFPLARQDVKAAVDRPKRAPDDKPHLKPKLKAVKEAGVIEIDATTTLSGIPTAAWDYKLGNRSGLEWVLDQWKEHKIGDPTVAEKFDTYRFADHKEYVIDLLRRVCTVSVETMKIVRSMP
jgi:predicted helicase